MASNSITDVNNHHVLQEELLFELYVNYCFYMINKMLDVWLDSRWQCLISFQSRNHKEAMRLWVDEYDIPAGNEIALLSSHWCYCSIILVVPKSHIFVCQMSPV